MLSHEENLTEKLTAIRQIFAQNSEWLLVEFGKSFALKAEEIEVSIKHEALFLEFPAPQGWQTWRIENFADDAEKLTFDCSRRFGAEKNKIVFVARVSAKVLIAEVTVSRQAKAIRLAEIAGKTLPLAEIANVGLSRGVRQGEVGKFAQILLRQPNGKLTAVCGAIVEKVEIEKLLVNAILWFDKLRERRKSYNFKELWLIADQESVENLQKLHALLNAHWQRNIRLFFREIAVPESEEEVEIHEAEFTNYELREVEKIEFSALWREDVKKLSRRKPFELSRTAQRIIELSPDEIDAVRSKKGETLRFRGFPFARVRKILDEEKVWFGADEKTRQILHTGNLKDFEKLFDELQQNRRADAPLKRNFLAKSAPEAWLECLLRQDISRLDPNLILAPLHAQLRLTSPPNSLDLLALRTDGRLVVIELKVSPDREFVFQAIDYWRQVELQRRAGNFEKSGLFGTLKILDAPPLVYLVAPLLAFHRDFEKLASCVAPEIEIWRYDLNETWRQGIKVARCQQVKN